jgi:type IV pilus assembly protein PilA
MISLANQLKKKQGFTLIELMIVVAIIGILAAIAIPNFLKFQLRSKAGEGKLNLAGIRTAQESYFAEAGTFVAWNSFPGAAGVLFSQKQVWCAPGGVAPPCCPVPLPPVAPGAPPPPAVAHCYIGWEPEGDVYYNYQVITSAAFPANQFWAAGQSDIDGDLTPNIWGLDKPNILNVSLGGGPYGCNNVLNKQTAAPMVHQVGPCNTTENGLNVF